MKHETKATIHSTLEALNRGIVGDVVSTAFGVYGGVFAASVAAVIIPGGSEVKDALQAIGTMTAAIVGYDYTHKAYKCIFDGIADMHHYKVLKERELAIAEIEDEEEPELKEALN